MRCDVISAWWVYWATANAGLENAGAGPSYEAGVLQRP